MYPRIPLHIIEQSIKVFFESIERGIQTYAGSGYILLIGDSNARCGKKNDYYSENDSFLKNADFQCNSYEEKDFPVRLIIR